LELERQTIKKRARRIPGDDQPSGCRSELWPGTISKLGPLRVMRCVRGGKGSLRQPHALLSVGARLFPALRLR